MRSTALGRHLMRFVSPSLASSVQTAATGGASTSTLSSSIVSLRSSSSPTFRGSSSSRSSLGAAAHSSSSSSSSSSRFLAPSALRAMSSGGGIGRTNVAAAATAAGATEATAAATATTDAADAAGAAATSSSHQKRRGSALDAVLAPLEAVVGPLSREPMVPAHAPLVLVVSGPSGVGKDAAIRALHRARPGLRFVVTATSRARRPGEADGVDYSFVSKAEFEAMISRGELLEHAMVYGEYKGIPKRAVEAALEAARRDVEREGAVVPGGDGAAAAAAAPSSSSPSASSSSGAGVVVLRLDVQGAATVRSLLPARSVASVFLAAESEAALAARLAARGTEAPAALATRVATARSEAARASEFDFVVVNAEGDVEGTVRALGAIVDAERCRSSRRLPLPAP